MVTAKVPTITHKRCPIGKGHLKKERHAHNRIDKYRALLLGMRAGIGHHTRRTRKRLILRYGSLRHLLWRNSTGALMRIYKSINIISCATHWLHDMGTGSNGTDKRLGTTTNTQDQKCQHHDAYLPGATRAHKLNERTKESS